MADEVTETLQGVVNNEDTECIVDAEIDGDDSDGVIVQGTLSKWTNYIHGWQTRFIILKDGTLSYYKSNRTVDLDVVARLVCNKANIKSESSYGSENNFKRHVVPFHLCPPHNHHSTTSADSFTKRGIRGLKEKLAEIETFKDILIKQIDTLQKYFDNCVEKRKKRKLRHRLIQLNNQ